MADEQKYAFIDGSVKAAPDWKSTSTSEQKLIVEEAFGGFLHLKYEWLDEKATIKSASLIDLDGDRRVVYFVIRSVSGGGRPGSRPTELRSQIAPGVLNDLCAINNRGDTALIIGVYRNEEATALVLWRPLDGSAGNGSASKQIDAEVIAKALVDGVSSCVYPDGEVVYALVPKMFRAYLDCFMPKRKAPPSAPEVSKNVSGSRNLIFFGAPGTGKSYQLNRRSVGSHGNAGLFSEKNVRRVTFHSDYTYAQFVGCFKPCSVPDIRSDDPASAIKNAPTRIEYRFVPGPFIDTYVESIKHPDQNYLLIIEEINRTNASAAFGDIFQLLDRKDDGTSEYPIAVSSDLHDYLKVQVGPFLKDEKGVPFGTSIRNPALDEATSKISLPANMYIWATMNSADQGVFPMDTAFKRRWDFEYMDINAPIAVAEIDRYDVPLGNTGERAKWNDLREAINNVLRKAKVNEDKWLGPFFIKPSALKDDEAFLRTFKSKVLLYLYEDAAKTKRSSVFSDSSITYSELCKAFDENGLDIFEGMDQIGIFPESNADEGMAESEG